MTEINTTTRSNEPLGENELKLKEEEKAKDLELITELKNINLDSKDLLSLTNDLVKFEENLKSLNNVCNIFTDEVFDIFKKISEKENIKMHLILSRIYINIISNDSLYKDYLLFQEDDPNKLDKVDCLLKLIEQCTSLIEKLSGFVFDPELFKFKNKTLDLLKCIYFNCKSKIKDDAKINKLQEYLDTLPPKFYSNAFTELNKNKDIFEVFKSQTQDKITSFEDKFLEINNYFEQFEVFKKFVENNSGNINYTSINDENIGKNSENPKGTTMADNDKVDFYEMYGLLLLKFCKYHNYVFLNKEEKEEEKKVDENQEDENESSKVVFLLDKVKKDEALKENEGEEKKEEEVKTDEVKNEKSQKIENLLLDKQFHSIIDSDDYKDLIKKEINYFLKHTKSLENNEKLKSLREQMIYYISTLGVESYVPLYLKDFSKIAISDNFTPSFVTNVPAGKENKLYIETKKDENMLVYVEFFLEDKSKDISFEVNKYDVGTNTYKSIFKEEKVEETYKFFVLCNGYSLYQIIFNNDYSWFNSKDVNYRISLLKQMDKPKIEPKEGEFCANLEGKTHLFNNEAIAKKIENKEDETFINIPVILYLNNLRIASFKKDENGQCLLSFKEIIEEDEKYIPKHVFDFQLISFLKKNKIKTNEQKKIIVSIFSQNRDLENISKEIREKIRNAQDSRCKEYLQKIGFVPTEEFDDYKIEYKLYDLCEQNLIYHLYSCYKKKIKIEKPLLLLKFDKEVITYAIYNEGNIFTKLKGVKISLNKNNCEEYALNVIENANDECVGVNVILSYIDCKDNEKRKQLIELFRNIKNKCQNIDNSIKVEEYDNNLINIEVFKYINLFYDN